MNTTLTWLGQLGFAVQVGDQITLLDPWLTGHPADPRGPVDAEATARGVHSILVSHEHEDHFDRDFISLAARQNPGLRVVLPQEISAEARALIGADKVIGAAPGESHEIGVLRVEPVRSDHMLTGEPPEPGYLGYLVELPGGVTLYHAGDGVVTRAVMEGLRGKRVDIAVLPVNGRDFFREQRDLVGNMNVREAVEFAHWLGARILVPAHWDADPGNTERPGAVADYAWEFGSSVHTLVMARGVPLRIDALL